MTADYRHINRRTIIRNRILNQFGKAIQAGTKGRIGFQKSNKKRFLRWFELSKG